MDNHFVSLKAEGKELVGPPKGLIGLVIRMKCARDLHGANLFLIGVIFFCLFSISILLLTFTTLFGPKELPIPYDEIQKVMQL